MASKLTPSSIVFRTGPRFDPFGLLIVDCQKPRPDRGIPYAL